MLNRKKNNDTEGERENGGKARVSNVSLNYNLHYLNKFSARQKMKIKSGQKNAQSKLSFVISACCINIFLCSFCSTTNDNGLLERIDPLRLMPSF